ncbi:hypothetical protein [Mycobacteroides abscessus]|uniref:Uncharacterized protein n=1 Tax=Mycobacteroides abscessus TaxID=36809 RepID=A0A0U0ZQV5_9MYCO|nr:hypothetical protein [Mycobacteroides abscessus]CPV66110.1 Uncharacterised protein [Mycobacteroides abscessus]
MTNLNDDEFINEQIRDNMARRHSLGHLSPEAAKQLWSTPGKRPLLGRSTKELRDEFIRSSLASSPEEREKFIQLIDSMRSRSGRCTTDMTLAGFLAEAIAAGKQVDVLDRGTICGLGLAHYDNLTLHTGVSAHVARVEAIYQLMITRYDALEANQVEPEALKPVVLAIDKYPGFLAEAVPTDPDIENKLHAILRLGRTAKIQFVIALPATARIEDVFPAEALDNFGWGFHHVFATPDTSQN